MELQPLAITGVLAGDFNLVVLQTKLLRVGRQLEVHIVLLHVTFGDTVEGDVADVFNLDLDLALGRAEGASLQVQSVEYERGDQELCDEDIAN